MPNVMTQYAMPTNAVQFASAPWKRAFVTVAQRHEARQRPWKGCNALACMGVWNSRAGCSREAARTILPLEEGNIVEGAIVATHDDRGVVRVNPRGVVQRKICRAELLRRRAEPRGWLPLGSAKGREQDTVNSAGRRAHRDVESRLVPRPHDRVHDQVQQEARRRTDH